MEAVLDVYKQPYDSLRPVVCMDETSFQLISEVRQPIKAAPGRVARVDYEYARAGVCNVFMAVEPLSGKRIVQITERRTKKDWAKFLKEIAEHYPQAEKITLVMDNLNTHKAGSLYETFIPELAKSLREKFEFVYTPVHGSWLNMAEIELSALFRQCLSRRVACIDLVKKYVRAWALERDSNGITINWQFTTEDARIKLIRLYPTFDA